MMIKQISMYSNLHGHVSQNRYKQIKYIFHEKKNIGQRENIRFI